MRGAQLPPVKVTNGHQMRLVVAKAISEVEVYGKRASAAPASLQQLLDFLAAATTAVNLVKAYPASIVASAPDVALSLTTDLTEQIVVTATGLGGATSNVAATSSYVSSNTAVVTVSATGLVTAVGLGSATVTATYQNKTSNALAFTVAA